MSRLQIALAAIALALVVGFVTNQPVIIVLGLLAFIVTAINDVVTDLSKPLPQQPKSKR